MRKVITVVVVIIVLLSIFFIKTNYKIFTFGNNKSNKSADKIKKYVLGITSYEANEEITVNSNKNTNKYQIYEKYLKENNISSIEINKPENLEGTKLIYDGQNLKIENEKINILYFYQNYKYIGENDLTLAKFIEDYKNCEKSNITEEDNNYIIEIENKNGNKYNNYKKLYLNKKDLKPCKLEVKDITQNTKIYILYNEIKINNLQEDEVLI